MELAKQISFVTCSFPIQKTFGLTARRRRAAVSLPSNIGETQLRHGRTEFVQFLPHAQGSWAELDTQLAPAVELGSPRDPGSHQSIWWVGELQKLLASLRQKVAVRPAANR